ncbi:Receptor expression-enhancing protein 4 OS=Mus musculus GN=Reep4 PE=2 SV=1 [Rhizoctonia solani AG-1 IB]|uniref:Protein YOP1 n=1 Tax=Thanatephorus cucumeris (strain AG1-IB / isolate 7/3/14) TaxID=1108050 RepID=M5BMT5_THACB|nr:Receptor expression-enhancing protein 4 [Rhizoctonia solani AG-1 IB]CEL53872.1 Receptor expression-enhancing protein 4 OS=Mus musculus GN=Reep4 PE=2 SV=1 [Rhizoctonia solani AG-1 IB]
MVFFHFAKACSIVYVFLYPGYGIYKTLKSEPAAPEEQKAQAAELKRWLEYWAVMAFVMSAEYLAEWVVSWFPGYWLFKSIFLVWLVAPQTQGATFVFHHLLAPYLAQHEPEIDARLKGLNSSVIAYFQDQLGQLLAAVLPSMTPQQGQPGQPQANFAAGMMLSMLHQYAPNVLARSQHYSSRPGTPDAKQEAKASAYELRPELNHNESQASITSQASAISVM